jgi:hypothetical protein
MTNGTAALNPAPPVDSHVPGSQDDDTVVTPPRRAQKSNSDDQSDEKTLMFRFPVIVDLEKSIVPPPVLHYHFIAAVQDAFGDQIQVLDNNNRKVGKIDVISFDIKSQKHSFKWYNNSAKKRSGFAPPVESTPNDRRTTKYVSHRIRTSLSMADIKSNERIKRLLIDHNFYVNFHRWDETEWDIAQLGFFFGLDPTFLNVDQATSKVTATLQAAIAAKASPRPKMPKFKLVFGSPKITAPNNRTARTKAYAIECPRALSKELIDMLKEAYKTTGSFIAYNMRQRNPEALHKLIRAQTQFIANNRVILLNHIGEGAIFYLDQHITAIPGVQGLLPTRNPGQYKVSVQEKDFQRIRKYLQQNLSTLYKTHVTVDAQNSDGPFESPPEVAPISSDDYSDGEQSYMTVSINAAMSMVSLLSDEDGQTIQTQGTTAATQVTKPIPQRIQGWPTPSGNTVETPSSATQQSTIDQTILTDLAASRAEVEALKIQVTQLVAQRESQAQQIAEAVHAQVTRALAAQPPPASNSTPSTAPVTQDQFSAFLTMQSTKFDAMTEMFRVMIVQSTSTQASAPQVPADNPPPQSATPPPSGEHGSNASKRTAPIDLESDLETDQGMEVDSEPSNSSRKRTDVRPSPVKPPQQLFPLFKKDSARNNDISRNLFGGTPQMASPTNVPLPLSSVQDTSTPTSLTVAEDVQRCISSGNESENLALSESPAEDVSTQANNHVE